MNKVRFPIDMNKVKYHISWYAKLMPLFSVLPNKDFSVSFIHFLMKFKVGSTILQNKKGWQYNFVKKEGLAVQSIYLIFVE